MYAKFIVDYVPAQLEHNKWQCYSPANITIIFEHFLCAKKKTFIFKEEIT